MSKKIIPFNYFGGKFSHVEWVLKHLPETRIYVEPFGGSGVVLFNKKPAQIETYNDIDSVVVNFFKVLRNKPEELLNKIFLTPYSREEYFECYKNINQGDDVERARRFFVVVNQSFNGTYSRQTGWKISTKVYGATISEAVNRWLTKIPNLIKIIDRLRKIQISNYDFRVIFEKFDHPDTLFYCDPPYLHETRCNKNEYKNEMSLQDHTDLLTICKNIKGKICISGYDNELYSSELNSFYKSTAKEKRNTLMHSKRREIIWTNYDPNSVSLNLFFNQ